MAGECAVAADLSGMRAIIAVRCGRRVEMDDADLSVRDGMFVGAGNARREKQQHQQAKTNHEPSQQRRPAIRQLDE